MTSNGRNWKGFGRSGRGFMTHCYGAVWRYWGKSRQISASMTSVPAEIRTEYLRSSSQKRYCSASRLSLKDVLRYLSVYLSRDLRSCCSHLQHTASVKRFVSLQFLNLRQSVGLLGRGSALARLLPTQDNTNTE
jgi:hypothetical protein